RGSERSGRSGGDRTGGDLAGQVLPQDGGLLQRLRRRRAHDRRDDSAEPRKETQKTFLEEATMFIRISRGHLGGEAQRLPSHSTLLQGTTSVEVVYSRSRGTEINLAAMGLSPSSVP